MEILGVPLDFAPRLRDKKKINTEAQERSEEHGERLEFRIRNQL